MARTNGYIGKSNWSGEGFFDGMIDDLGIYNRILTVNEIMCHADLCSYRCVTC